MNVVYGRLLKLFSGLFFRSQASPENHIDIYDGSEVQPPSYLNVKDAPGKHDD